MSSTGAGGVQRCGGRGERPHFDGRSGEPLQRTREPGGGLCECSTCRRPLGSVPCGGDRGGAVIPVVTPDEMGAIDAAATEPVEVLIGRAGAAVARAAIACWVARYGRRVVVVAGKGNNGNDGRVGGRAPAPGAACGWWSSTPPRRRPGVPPCDLVIDAAYGTGFRGTWRAPDPGDAPVLAVDIPSGVDGLTGRPADGRADGRGHRHLRRPEAGPAARAGRELAGAVEVADIGLDRRRRAPHLVERRRRGVVAWPARPTDAHKWQAAVVWIVAGSPGMLGAAHLSAAAPRSGPGPAWCACRRLVSAADPAAAAPRSSAAAARPTAGPPTVLADARRFHAARRRARARARGRRRRRSVRELVAKADRCRSWSTATACSRR